jgi:CheY-like chemotaxis protein
VVSPAPSPFPTHPGQSLADKRALVIDEDQLERRRLVQFLTGWGISVEVTANPLHGLALLWGALEEEQPFDLALFGPHGHRVLGEQFAALVRSEPRLAELPMLHIGDGAGTGQKATLRRVGFFDTVPVPLDKTLLFGTLHRACGTLGSEAGAGVVRLMDRQMALGSSTPRLDILLAEPSREQRHIVRSTLARGGHRIYEVDSGEQALDALAKHNFDLVIVALDLPDIDTADAFKLFRFSMTRDAWPACIGLAREPDMGQVRDYASVGITAIIPSPVQPQVLLGAVADAIRGNGVGTGTAPSALAPAAGTPTEVTCLDERALREVEQLSLDPNFLYELIQEFLGDIGTLLEGVLQTLGTEQCHPRLCEFGHILQDNAGSLGALQLYEFGLIASQYPEDLFERDGEQLLGRIKSSYQHTRGAFWQYLQRRALSRSPG